MNALASLPGLSAVRPMPLPQALPGNLASPALSAKDLRELPSPLQIGPSTATPRLDQVNTSSGSFDKALGRFVGEVNQKQLQAADTVRGLLSGENVQLHQAVLAMEEASVSFQLMVEVRNKLLESYQELMRMQI